MALQRFTIKAKCIVDDAELYRNIESALERNLQVVPQREPHDQIAVLVGSGPSVSQFTQEIRDHWLTPGYDIVAIKDAHDWLLRQSIVPDFAVAIDPQESRADVFALRSTATKYLLASQCHPALFDQMWECDIALWHCYVRQGQTIPPPGTPLISGGTTTGLRAITLLYTMGYRTFELYGYDSCLTNGVLRMDGSLPRKGDDQINEIVVGGKHFFCNPSMTAQAAEFQNLFLSMPDLSLRSHGDGLITAILNERAAQPIRTISFIHGGGEQSASFRLRAQIPASYLDQCQLNNFSADVLIFSKPEPFLVRDVKWALGQGKVVIVDICDNHLERDEYRDMVRLADVVTCATEELAQAIRPFARDPIVVPEPYEGDEHPPHCHGDNLLWFGHPSNLYGLFDGPLHKLPNLTIVTNRDAVMPPTENMVQWSPETLAVELAKADFVLMPKTASYKSPNRTIEAIRAGCFVVADPHPSLHGIPGIWVGNIHDGLTWAKHHREDANAWIRMAQLYVSKAHAPRTVASAWSRVIQACPSTWGAAPVTGPDGSTSTTTPAPTYAQTSPG